ncbi:hypothetical protein [uncultured Roseobacter sp.]|uniref:hypothetical protein n=1 Tax=uncultured Roseobacter sp. TaxID=114847 RepID=UPI00261E134A|nr:hypothetical protein [uncultured Roseobacter sp.]
MTDAPNNDTIIANLKEKKRDGLSFDEIDTDRLTERSLIEADYERFAHFLDGLDASEAEKREFVQTVWNIVFAVASLGFQSHPIQIVEKICGKRDFKEAANGKRTRKMLS